MYEAMGEVVDRLRQDAGYDVCAAKPAARRRFVDAFVSVMVREARKHGAHEKGEPCVFSGSARAETSAYVMDAGMLADRIRRRGRLKSIRKQGLDMGFANQRQRTERPIEVALRKAGRRVPPHPSGRPWDRPPRGFAEAIRDALRESEKFAKESWRVEAEPLPDWMSFPPATDKRVARAGDRVMRNALFFDFVSRHLFSAVRHKTGEHENDQEKDKTDLAQQIRRKYIEVLAPKVRQIGDIEHRRWVEVELGLPPDTLKTPTS
jgi:hypothetical protein